MSTSTGAPAGSDRAGADGAAVRLRVPATSANLGPGFDSLGIALGLHDGLELREVEGEPPGADQPPPCRVDVTGEGAAAVPRDERHLVVRAVTATYAEAGVPRPRLHLSTDNVVPHSRGLGSSAAAVVGGIVAARALLGPAGPSDEDVLDLAARFEGHADNVGACLLGGLVVCWGTHGTFRAARLDPHPDLDPVAFVAERSSATEATRGLLPDHVPHADAAFTGARAALAVHALTTAPELLMAATEDRLHQPYRRPAYPETAALVDALRGEGIPAFVSGAGPTVLTLTGGDALAGRPEPAGFRVLRLPVDPAGAVAVDG